jgi:hypothetical protein
MKSVVDIFNSEITKHNKVSSLPIDVIVIKFNFLQ